jgi:hypothetical protein
MMCPAADDWREYWKTKVEWAFNTFDFDGIYFDMWFGKMFCENPLHGCNTRFRRAAYPWLRDMMVRAYNVMKTKKERALIRVNTNFMPIAMFNSLIDIRLVGEARNIETMGPDERFGYYFSYRLGSNTQTITRGDRWSFNQWLNFGLANMSLLLPRGGGSEEEVRLLGRFVDTFRFLPVESSRFYPYLAGVEPIKPDRPEVHLNIHTAKRGILLTVINDSPKPLRTCLELIKPEVLNLLGSSRYRIYEPVADTFLWPMISTGEDVFPMWLNLKAHDSRLLFITPWTEERPWVLCALGAEDVINEDWDADNRLYKFELTVSKPVNPEASPSRLFSGSIWGRPLEVTLYCPVGRPESVERNGREIPFKWNSKTGLARLSVKHLEKEKYVVKL